MDDEAKKALSSNLNGVAGRNFSGGSAPDPRIALQNVNKLSKLLAKIVPWNNAKIMHRSICKKLLP